MTDDSSVLKMPKFSSESEEADWWAGPSGRAYVKQKSVSVQSMGTKAGGSSLVAMLDKKRSVQIAIRLPEADLAQARRIAERKGIGYQTLLKMLWREALYGKPAAAEIRVSLKSSGLWKPRILIRNR